jgi:hypothetical protein
MMNKVIPADAKFNDDEWLTFIQSQSFFDFLNDFEKANLVIVQITNRLPTMSIEVSAKILMILSHFKEFSNITVQIADSINNKMEEEILKGSNLGSIKPVTLFELFVSFIQLSTESKSHFKWRKLLTKRLRENFSLLSKSYKLLIMWKLISFDEGLAMEFSIHLPGMAENCENGLNFYEKYLLNQVLASIENQKNSEIVQLANKTKNEQIYNFGSLMSEKITRQSLIKLEVDSICGYAIGKDEYEKLLHNLREIIEEATKSKVSTNHFVETQRGHCFYVPVYVQNLNLCVMIVNDHAGSNNRNSQFAKINSYCIEKNGFRVKYVSLTSLLDRNFDEEVISIETMQSHRRDFVLGLLDLKSN